MDTFRNKIAALNKANKMLQTELAKSLSTSASVIRRYECEEMPPFFEAAKKSLIS